MECLRIENGIIVNVELWDECPSDLVEAPDGASIGWLDNGDGTFSPPIVPEVPKTQEQINAEYRAYLDSTDWYAIRESETGEKIPNQILKARQDARDGVIG